MVDGTAEAEIDAFLGQGKSFEEFIIVSDLDLESDLEKLLDQ